ncbi:MULTISPECIES: RecE family exodeoxyribonuclease [Enterobacterales]|uniref:RecE family exodeoxyribonuclease n=1 Tax=Enterobacterales TaxID=91347 RepID=UPI002ED8517F
MSEKKPYFIHHRAKKQSGEPTAVFWESAMTDTRALRDAENALEDAGKDAGNYFRPVVTNFPVVDELPEEGEIDFDWCNFFQLGDDGMTWAVIPGAVREEKVVAGIDTTIVDGVDTNTGEIIDVDKAGTVDTTATVTVENGLVVDESDDKNTRYAVVTLPFRKRLIAQLTADQNATEQRHHVTRAEHAAITAIEMDTDNSYVQNLLLAGEQFDELKNCDTKDLRRYTDAVQRAFLREKRHELGTLLKFTKIWLATDYLDRGILVHEWEAGNRISEVPHTSTDGGNSTTPPLQDAAPYKRAVSQSMANLQIEVAVALLYPEAEPGKVSRPQLAGAKALVERNEDVFDIALKVLGKTTDILDFNADTIFLVTRAIEWNSGKTYFELRALTRDWFTENGVYENGERCKGYPEWNEDPRSARNSADSNTTQQPQIENLGAGVFSVENLMGEQSLNESEKQQDVNKQLAAGRGEFVEGISDPEASNWVHEDLAKTASNEGEKSEVETTSDVQIQEAVIDEEQAGDALQAGKSRGEAGEETTAVEPTASEILAANAPHLASQDQEEIEAEVKQWPTHFEPGRYENLPNDVYHAANGVSSTMLKDVRISPMFYCGRHVTKAIPRTQNDAMKRGTVVHGYVLEPEKFHEEFAVPAEMPDGVVSTTGDLQAIIKEYNASLPALMTPDELKGWIEAYNNDLTPPLSLSGSAEETGLLYMSLPEDFQRLPADTKQTATQQKGCIKEYNASLPALLKTSGTRDQLLDQIATVAPDMAAAERAKFVPYNFSGTKEQLTEIVRTLRPDVMTADDWHKQQEIAAAGKIMISLDMYEQAKNISAALQAHPSASRLLNHPARQSEISYFGFDEETGLEVRVRPDLEIQLPHSRIGGDLKTISLGYVKQENLRARLHREIIDRDYHLSAAMYCDVANLDQFSWIFVCRDEGYHWIAVVEASVDELELGRLEYRRALQTINDCTMSGSWPAPITDDYTDELNDYDLRRYEALSAM